MKKTLTFFILLLILFTSLYANKVIEIKYNTNIYEYIKLSQGLTDEEKIILEENQPLIYGGNINEPPLGIYYEDNGLYMGLMVDYINAISIELGTPILSRPMVWDDALEALSKGETDLCDMIPSKKRAEQFVFTDPLYYLRSIAVVSKDKKDVIRLSDIDMDLKVGVQKGDVAIEYLDKLGIKTNLVQKENVTAALELFDKGLIDVVIGDEPVIKYHLKEISNVEDYRILDQTIYEENAVLAIPKEKDELVRIINKAIFNLKRKGILGQIENKWKSISGSFIQDRTDEIWIFAVVSILVLITIALYLVYAWNRSLTFLVAARTKELGITKNELQIAFNGMKNYLVVMGDDGCVSNTNNAFLSFLNVSREEILGTEYNDIEILRIIEEENEKVFSGVLGDDEHSEDFIKLDLNHKNRNFEVVIHKLTDDKFTTIQVLVMIIDKTLEKIRERKIVQTSKMEAMGQLASGIAHELRNPLGVIRNSSFILEGELDPDDLLNQKTITAINNSVNRASKIIDNLLNFSRLTDDNVECINLKDTVSEITGFFGKKLGDRNIYLDTENIEDIDMVVNSESLRHVIINLISNAIDAIDTDGIIKISCELVGEEVVICISDNGAGIPKTVQDSVYDPFFTTKEAGDGTGLGLYIVYKEVQNINGSITFDSSENIGTTFKISIKRKGCS